ncbi:MAG: Asp-tRNA(Asn)/Glu-tRNA(Gln) amidotransferase subunit GatA [candidate division KSB1 bacterium]|nr:Asp-tRNA(Asn)/Glu-tRNA(Gln) amidotransferase subunit GatA [candidate division KSB1 bacterium]
MPTSWPRDYTELRPLLLRGEVSCVQVVEDCLSRIGQSRLNAFITVFGEQALRRARVVDRHLAKGKAGALAGLAVGIKDNIHVRGWPTTCGSRHLRVFVAPFSATVVSRLLRSGAIVVGKTNMDEFGMGSSGESSYHGPTRNPHDLGRVPGGSSSGSAAAVAGGEVWAALGSDTGGSVRQPASFCGLVGLKPTYGRVSRYGLVAFGSSLDQIGPLTRSVNDCALLLEVIAGHDRRDATSARVPPGSWLDELHKGVRGLRIGRPAEYFRPPLDSEVAAAVDRMLNELCAQGASVVEMSLPHTRYAVAAYYVTCTAEACSNLSRFDGLRFGERVAGVGLEETYAMSRSAGFGPEVQRRIMLGSFVLSAGHYKAYYGKAQRVRSLLREEFAQAFRKVDCVVTPTSPTTAFGLGERTQDPLTMYMSDVYTVSPSLCGLPAISVPCGKDRNGLPIGLQVIGRYFDEATLLRVARAVELTAGQLFAHGQ